MAKKRMTKSEFVGPSPRRAAWRKAGERCPDRAERSRLQGTEQGRAGEVVLPGLIKLVTVKKPAVPAREGINPFTGQPAVFKAKPASKVVKARPVKQLKDAIK